MVNVYVFRHGEAEHNFHSDCERNLTQNGRAQIRDSVSQHLPHLQSVGLVLTSSLVRAKQSGEIITSSLNLAGAQEVDWLAPASSVSEAVECLQKVVLNSGHNAIVLVTHLPFVASFLESLCGLNRGAIVMPTGSVAAINAEVIAASCAELRWHCHPQ